MQRTPNRKRTWLFSAVLATGLFTLAPTTPARADPWDSEAQIKYDRTPRDVRDALDRERRNHDIKRIDWVRRDGRVFYRAIIDEKGDDLVVRISESGRVLSREDARDVPVGRERDRDVRAGGGYDLGGDERQIKYNAAPDRVKDALDRERGRRELRAVYEVRTASGRVFYRGVIDERGTDRVVRIADDGRVLGESDFNGPERDREARPAAAILDRRNYDDGREVNYDRLPGPVRAGIAKEARANQVQRVTEYRTRDNHIIYRAEVGNGDRGWIIRVDETGRYLGTSNATEEGKLRVDFKDLPGAVKATINREIPDRSRGAIVQITRNGRTYYRAEEDQGPTSRWVTVDDAGRITGELDRPDTSRDRR